MTTTILDFYFTKLPECWQRYKLGKDTDCVVNINDIYGSDVAIGTLISTDSFSDYYWKITYRYNGILYVVDASTTPGSTGEIHVCASLIEPYKIGEYTELKILCEGIEYTTGSGCTKLTITAVPCTLPTCLFTIV